MQTTRAGQEAAAEEPPAACTALGAKSGNEAGLLPSMGSSGQDDVAESLMLRLRGGRARAQSTAAAL